MERFRVSWNDPKYDYCKWLGGIMILCKGEICNTCERCDTHCMCMYHARTGLYLDI